MGLDAAAGFTGGLEHRGSVVSPLQSSSLQGFTTRSKTAAECVDLGSFFAHSRERDELLCSLSLLEKYLVETFGRFSGGCQVCFKRGIYTCFFFFFLSFFLFLFSFFYVFFSIPFGVFFVLFLWEFLNTSSLSFTCYFFLCFFSLISLDYVCLFFFVLHHFTFSFLRLSLFFLSSQIFEIHCAKLFTHPL